MQKTKYKTSNLNYASCTECAFRATQIHENATCIRIAHRDWSRENDLKPSYVNNRSQADRSHLRRDREKAINRIRATDDLIHVRSKRASRISVPCIGGSVRRCLALARCVGRMIRNCDKYNGRTLTDSRWFLAETLRGKQREPREESRARARVIRGAFSS